MVQVLSVGDKIRATHLDLYKAILVALVAKMPFGVDIDEDQAEALAEEAEEITNAAVHKLKPVLFPGTHIARNHEIEDFDEETHAAHAVA